MIDNLKPYPTRKNSGLPWLGTIPAHWMVWRNGRLFKKAGDTGFPDLPILEVSLKSGVRVRDFERSDRKQVMNNREKYQRAQAGDLSYNMMRMWQGAVGVAPVDGLVSPAYVVARPLAGVEGRYYAYLFRTGVYMDEVGQYSRGIVPDRNRLYWEQFKQMPSLVPPYDEQFGIVRFLDYIDNRIRRYIRAKEKMVKLLEEQKLAIIRRAVTRGLDPNVRLRPSGVKWLGDVPEHWEVFPLSRVTIARCDGPFGSGLKSSHYADNGIRVVRLQNIGHGEYRDSDAAFISESHYLTLGDHSIEAGDVLVAGLGDERHPAGRACVAPDSILPAMVKADCFRFRVDSARLNPKFAALHLSATARVASAILSTGATRQRTNLRSTSAREVCVPPIREQGEIVETIAKDKCVLENAISGADQEISLLCEYRTRLIADVVTGKVDVREAAAHLPEETNKQEPLDEADDPYSSDDDTIDDLEPIPEEEEA